MGSPPRTLDAYLATTIERRIAILRAKNHDYAGAGQPFFRNFTLCERLSICSVATGLCVRMCDKLGRVRSLLTQDPAVVGESLADTLDDLANYAAILFVWLQQGPEGTLADVEAAVRRVSVASMQTQWDDVLAEGGTPQRLLALMEFYLELYDQDPDQIIAHAATLLGYQLWQQTVDTPSRVDGREPGDQHRHREGQGCVRS